MITTVLFDLDGTLLPMEQEHFVKVYFGGLCRRLAPRGYDPKALVAAIWEGTGAMVQNDGTVTNETRFWESFRARFGERVMEDLPIFDAFYREDFDAVSASCGYQPAAKATVLRLLERGARVALATNPIFPAVATEKRIAWAGLSPSDFELYTTYENSCHCKPNPAYYEDVMRALGVRPEECVMVGNDVEEDMIAETLGMQVFLVTDCLINKHGRDISLYPHGDFEALNRYLESLPITPKK